MVATKEMGALIDANAAVAALEREKVKGGAMTEAEAADIIKRNATTFQAYADAKTLNLFAYWFDKKKALLVNDEYAQRLDAAAILAAETVLRVNAGGLPPGWLFRVVELQSKILLDVKAAKSGKRSEE